MISDDETFEDFYDFKSIRKNCGVTSPCEDCSAYKICTECNKIFCTYAGSGSPENGSLICSFCWEKWESSQ
jgi:hypothetical protein